MSFKSFWAFKAKESVSTHLHAVVTGAHSE
jgi:hypothetical protein